MRAVAAETGAFAGFPLGDFVEVLAAANFAVDVAAFTTGLPVSASVVAAFLAAASGAAGFTIGMVGRTTVFGLMLAGCPAPDPVC